MSCTIGCVRILLFVFNFVFCLCGLVLLIPGIIVETNIGSIDGRTAEQAQQIHVAAISLIVIGSIIFIIAFFGCCGAIRESHCMIITFAVLLLTVLVIQVAISIFAFISLRNLNEGEITKGLEEPVSKYWTDKTSRAVVDVTQELLDCCGSNGPSDYSASHHNMNGSIPWSCCPVDANKERQFCNGSDKLFSRGCGSALTDFLKFVAKGLGGVALGIAGVELVGIIFALCLANSIRNENRRNYRV